ncbi:MAG: HAD-IB family hydrolase [Prevotella sp.]|nr:HAD-IB family hydrolase [Prevotella sp.]
MNRRSIAVFDFDGTLTTKDSFLKFIKFTHGLPSLVLGLIIHLPFVLAMKLRLCSNEFAKQRMFAYFYKGMDYERFCAYGRDFAACIESFSRKKMVEKLLNHHTKGHRVYIVSASMGEWIDPWAAKLGVDRVVATRVETDADNRLTGKFASPNCYGPEKVRRFLEVEPDRSSYLLYAYGDSQGDKEMIDCADFGTYCSSAGR